MRIKHTEGLAPSNHNEQVSFPFEGKDLTGFVGEPIAAALMAADVRVFRYTASGQPRGLFCGVGRCGECQMVVDGRPGVLVCTEPLAAGMKVERQRE